jgi:hypothetical protein
MKELEKLLSKDEFDRFIYNIYFNNSGRFAFKDFKTTRLQFIISVAFT